MIKIKLRTSLPLLEKENMQENQKKNWLFYPWVSVNLTIFLVGIFVHCMSEKRPLVLQEILDIYQ